jgi:hypothetical protein
VFGIDYVNIKHIMDKNIELEIRAKINQKKYKSLLYWLKHRAKPVSKTKRLSAMFFGKVGNNFYDIRVRITNGQAEVVFKIGETHSHNRQELSQNLEPEQFIGMVKLFSSLFSNIKVGERQIENFKYKNDIIISLVKAGSINYIELEKMATKKSGGMAKNELLSLAQLLKLKIITKKSEYIKLCNLLTKKIDWQFRKTNKDYFRLKKLLLKYKK